MIFPRVEDYMAKTTKVIVFVVKKKLFFYHSYLSFSIYIVVRSGSSWLIYYLP